MQNIHSGDDVNHTKVDETFEKEFIRLPVSQAFLNILCDILPTHPDISSSIIIHFHDPQYKV